MTEEQIRADIQRRRQARELRQRRRRVNVLLCVVLLIVTVIGSIDAGSGTGKDVERDAPVQTEAPPSPSLSPEPVVDEMALYGCSLTGVYEYPFNTVSQDWNVEELTGFRYHDISRTAKANGGYFPAVAQIYAYIVCGRYGVDYEMVFALIETESGCRYDAAGDGGNSVGYMQIQGAWNEERMQRLSVTDLFNPFQNILVGVDILAELQDYVVESGTAPDMVQADTLAAYQYGIVGAQTNLWDAGVHLYGYNEAILDRAEELRQEAAERG